MNQETHLYNIRSYLRNFKSLGSRKYQFSCPVCGDSKKDTTKARGSVYPYKGELWYNCFNCGYFRPFIYFLKEFFPAEYNEYVFDKFKNVKKNNPPIDAGHQPDFEVREKSPLDHLLHLHEYMSHDAVFYLLRRGLEDYVDRFYYTENFKKFINDHVIENKYKHIDKPDPRIVLPFYDWNGKLIGLQGRTMIDSKARYLTIKTAPDDVRLIYGLDRINNNERVWVFEGPIDSLFIPNSVAAASSALHTVKDIHNPVLVWDNEPYSKEITSMMHRAIIKGHKLVIWGNNFPFKDINDMILGGLTSKKVVDIMSNRIFKGLKAELEFVKWKKI